VTMYQGLLFDTAIGRCGIALGERGVRAVQLPEASETRLRQQLARRASPLDLSSPTPSLLRLARRIRRHLDGHPDDLRDVPLDLEGLPPFARKVCCAARQVTPGRTVSYAELARLAGRPNGARAVGHAMATNPLPLLVPCHRVLAADGGLGGFSAHGGLATKLRLLTPEGADLGAVARAGVRTLRRDDRLGRLIRRVGSCRLIEHRRVDPFSALVESIIHQQVSMAAGATIFRRLCALTGRPTPRRLLAARPAELRAAGLSRQKASYLLDLSAHVASGALPLRQLERMDDERVIDLLTQVRGIGRWSAEMFLIFRLGRLNVLPVDDLGLRKGAQRVYRLRRLPDAERLRKLARPWIPFRSLATWYLWRAQDAGGL
jgi:O-6-methylguanine DNA methyltransferase